MPALLGLVQRYKSCEVEGAWFWRPPESVKEKLDHIEVPDRF